MRIINTLFLTLLVKVTCFGLFTYADVNTPPKPKNTITIRIPGEPETLDWNLAHTAVESDILMNIMEGLVTFDGESKVAPALAESWTLSPDRMTYTFKIRSGVKRTDGVPLKAQDFVYSWKRLLSPITAASYAYFLFDVEGAANFNKGVLRDFDQVGIKALDDSTLQVKLLRPVAHWIFIPAFWVTFPLRKDVVDKYGSGWETPGRMVTLGPYLLETHDIDSKITLKANPKYYGSKGNVDQVIAMVIKDDSLALNLYASGRLDFLSGISSMDLEKAKSRADVKIFPKFMTAYLTFVSDKYPVTNVKLRRAIAMAIDKTKIPTVLRGKQVPATSFVPPGMLAYSKDLGLQFNPVQAKAELRAPGIDGSNTVGLDLIHLNGETDSAIAQFVQGEVKKNLGIEINVQAFDNRSFRSQLDLHSFPVFSYTWTADYPDPDTYLSVFFSGSGNSRTTWKDLKYDAKVLQARQLQSPRDRERLYLEMQKTLQEEDAVIVPLYYEPNLALVRSRVSQLELNSLGYLYLKKAMVSQ